jgi:uncharacterized protein YjbJ (UPF0337 family)
LTSRRAYRARRAATTPSGSGEEGGIVSGTDKSKNKMQKARGKFKEVVGRATRNPTLETEGKDDQRKADMKDAGEKIKDAVRPKGRRRA